MRYFTEMNSLALALGILTSFELSDATEPERRTNNDEGGHDHRFLRRGKRDRNSSLDLNDIMMSGSMKKNMECEETMMDDGASMMMSCDVMGSTMGSLDTAKDADEMASDKKILMPKRKNKVGPWSFTGGNSMFVLEKSSTGIGSVHFDGMTTTTAALGLAGKMSAETIGSVSYDFAYDDETDEDEPPPFFTVRVGVSARTRNSFRVGRCWFEFTPVADYEAPDTNGFLTYAVDEITTRKNEADPTSENCPNTIKEMMMGDDNGDGDGSVGLSMSSMTNPNVFSIELVARKDESSSEEDETNEPMTMMTNMMGGYLDRVKLSFAMMDEGNGDSDSEMMKMTAYEFDMEPGTVKVTGRRRSSLYSRFVSFRTGWFVKSETRNVSFSEDQAAVGSGSMKLGPVTADAPRIYANLNMRRVLDDSATTSNLSSVSYDAYVMSGGDSSKFSLRLYANVPMMDDETTTETDAGTMMMVMDSDKRRKKRKRMSVFPTPDSFDCRFDYVPEEGVTGEWSMTTVTGDTIASEVTRGGENEVECPASYGDMPPGSTFGLLTIVVGNDDDESMTADGSSSSMDLEGYLDNVVLTFTDGGGFQTFDFEAM